MCLIEYTVCAHLSNFCRYDHIIILTSVCTMCGLCVRKRFTSWKMSTVPSSFTLSMAILMAQKAPDRPVPALQETQGVLAVRYTLLIPAMYHHRTVTSLLLPLNHLINNIKKSGYCWRWAFFWPASVVVLDYCAGVTELLLWTITCAT